MHIYSVRSIQWYQIKLDSSLSENGGDRMLPDTRLPTNAYSFYFNQGLQTGRGRTPGTAMGSRLGIGTAAGVGLS